MENEGRIDRGLTQENGMTFEEAAEKMGITPDAFRSFCEKWAITEVSLFGSILRDDFGPDCDVDLYRRTAILSEAQLIHES